MRVLYGEPGPQDYACEWIKKRDGETRYDRPDESNVPHGSNATMELQRWTLILAPDSKPKA
jgi:hypothetical protein